MTGVSFRVDGLEPAMRQLSALARATGDARPALTEIGKTVVDHTIDRFARGVSPDGDAWKPSRRARRIGGHTLVDEGHLRDSITYHAAPTEVAIGTAMIYGAIHHFGGEIEYAARLQVSRHDAAGGRFRSRKSARRQRGGSVRVSFASIGAHIVVMPARPYLGLDADDREDIPEILLRHLRTELRR